MEEKGIEIPVLPGRLTKIPVTETSHPFGGAAWTVDPMDIGQEGYIEEEYLIEGEAKVYTWPKECVHARVERAASPYVDRILVRKPVDMSKFSGNVIIEIQNWARGYDRPICAWSNCYEYIMQSGDAWVGVTMNAKSLQSLRQFDPERYARLGFPNPLPEEERNIRPQMNPFHGQTTDPATENGLAFDMLSQVAICVREQKQGYPFAGYEVKAVFGCGATPGDLATYVAAIDPISCREDGGNIFDGYLIFMTGAPGNVNQYEDKLYHLDPRCRFYAKVPLMRAYTCKDMLGTGMHPDWALMQRRNDSNEKGNYYRSYEIAGTGLMLSYVYHTEPCVEDIEKAGLAVKNGRTGKAWTEDELTRFEFPTRYALDAMFENLKAWARDGVNPPSTPKYDVVGVYPDIDLAEDKDGNVMGGLRLPYLRVPAYRYDRDATAEPFTSEVLKEKYGSFDNYIQLFRSAVEDCIKEKILLPCDRKKVLADGEMVRKLF